MTHRQSSYLPVKLSFSLLLFLSFAGFAAAQNTSVYDGMTPTGSWAAGSTNAVAGLEHYSSFSGALNASLPLYHAGGRGEAAFDLSWNFAQN